MSRGKCGQGPPLVITEVWSTLPLGITVMSKGVGVGGPRLGPDLWSTPGVLERDISVFTLCTSLNFCFLSHPVQVDVLAVMSHGGGGMSTKSTAEFFSLHWGLAAALLSILLFVYM